MTQPNYYIYTTIGGYATRLEIVADDPQAAIDIVSELLKEIESKATQLRVADASSGYFLRGYS